MKKFAESATPRYVETIFKALQKVEGDWLSEGTREFGSVRIHFLDGLD